MIRTSRGDSETLRKSSTDSATTDRLAFLGAAVQRVLRPDCDRADHTGQLPMRHGCIPAISPELDRRSAVAGRLEKDRTVGDIGETTCRPEVIELAVSQSWQM